jgi:hypothetical protein
VWFFSKGGVFLKHSKGVFMSLIPLRSRYALLVSAMILIASLAHAQNISSWKPNVGDRFICQVIELCNCGDWKCDGIDTLIFDIVSTSYRADNIHQNVVLAVTNAQARHLASYVWGRGGWSVTSLFAQYPDTTLISFDSTNTILTTFRAGASAEVSSKWTNSFPFVRDTSVVFEGESISAAKASYYDIFLPSLGWFYSMDGGQVDRNICCPGIATFESWVMQLISVEKVERSASSDQEPTFSLTSKNGLLELNTSTSLISILDLVGRPIRSWQLAASDGPHEIMLNVSDVPNGVYFLRLQGNGVDEVKRVAIIH